MTDGASTEPSALVEIRFMVPRAWHADFKAAADARMLSMADLLRQLMRDFLRPTPDEPAS